MRICFFLGKGGVGKSTLSSLTALDLAARGKKILLISLDPAHNLSDIFEKELSDKPSVIATNLQVTEVDHDKWIRNFLKQTENQLKTSYAYLTTFSMEKHFSVMQHAPALEEYALHQAFSAIVEQFKMMDYLIFDMPPTALALKFFALPQLSLLWLKNLQNLRKEISDKQQIISKLSLGEKTFERDRVMQNLNRQQQQWQYIDTLFRDPDISVPVVVENPDRLSAAETSRITGKMSLLGIKHLVKALNNAKSMQNKGYQLVVPQMEKMTGLAALQKAVMSIDFSGFVHII